jgi:hypothetical protein
MRLHPARHDLFRHAESRCDGGAINARLARHLQRCRSCSEETAKVEHTLRFAAQAGTIEPTRELTASILTAARAERHRQAHAHGGATVSLFRGIAAAAVLLLMAGLSFRTVLGDHLPGEDNAMRPADAGRTIAEGPSQEDLRKAAREVQMLTAVVEAATEQPGTPGELQQRRKEEALSADLSLALAALKRNPGCERASRLRNISLTRLADTRKHLYAERSL